MDDITLCISSNSNKPLPMSYLPASKNTSSSILKPRVKPIKKYQRLIHYAKSISKDHHFTEIKDDGTDQFYGHILPVLEPFETFLDINPKYLQRLKVIVYWHDLVENYKDKFRVSNPFNEHRMHTIGFGPISLNHLISTRGKEGEDICYGVFNISKYKPPVSDPEKGRAVENYWANFTNVQNHTQRMIIMKLLTGLGKTSDCRANNRGNEDCSENPKLLAKRFRNGIERLYRDIPRLEKFILDHEYEHFKLYNYTQVQSFFNNIKDNIYQFFDNNSIEHILKTMQEEKIQLKTNRYCYGWYDNALNDLGLMPKNISSIETFVNHGK